MKKNNNKNRPVPAPVLALRAKLNKAVKWLERNPKRSFAAMCFLLIFSVICLFAFPEKPNKSEFNLASNLKEETFSNTGTEKYSFSFTDYFKLRKIKEELEEIRAKDNLTKDDTTHLMKLINEFDQIDPSLKRDFRKQIVKLQEKTNNKATIKQTDISKTSKN